MKLCIFINRIQEVIAYLVEFRPDAEGQESELFSAYKIMNIIYYSIPNTLKNNMIEKRFIYADSTFKEMSYFFEKKNHGKKLKT